MNNPSFFILNLLCLQLVHAKHSGGQAPHDELKPNPCEISSSTSSEHRKDVTVKCVSGYDFILHLEDREGMSLLQVKGQKGSADEEELISVELSGANISIGILGETFDARDGNTTERESKALRGLLMDKDFSHFGTAVKVVHDKLQVPGWRSHSAMFLYRLGIAALQDHMKEQDSTGDEDGTLALQKRFWGLDRKYKDYHGPSPSKSCEQNGWSYATPDGLKLLKEEECMGTCGPSCWDCWDYVCGDCCHHTGCLSHDQHCSGTWGKFGSDCITLRGVLWDTVTDTPYDC